jgi:hypothetical protein
MASLINPKNIDITYPVAGQDNDTQGFRTNFTNIVNNLTQAAVEITSLQSNVASISANVSTIQTGSVVKLANLTTAQIVTISPTVPGMTVFNYDTGNVQVYNGAKWANIKLS